MDLVAGNKQVCSWVPNKMLVTISCACIDWCFVLVALVAGVTRVHSTNASLIQGFPGH
jgi:hypothetical protein